MAAEANRSVRHRSGRSAESLAAEQLERVGLADVAGRRVDTLPTGTARLVEVARALATDPKVLLLDEPASGLDPTESQGLAAVLESLAADGLAVLLVEHDVDLVMRTCATLTVLDRGRVIATGRPDEVQQMAVVQEAYLGPNEDAAAVDGAAAPDGPPAAVPT